MNLSHLIGKKSNKGIARRRKLNYEWETLIRKGDSKIFDADGFSDMDRLQAAMCSAIAYREKKFPGMQYVTRRLRGNQIALIRVR